MVLCPTCNRYMSSSVELEYQMCDWCIKMGFYYDDDGIIQDKRVDASPVHQGIKVKVEKEIGYMVGILNY